jgi:putative ABC transport system permease protein
MFNNYFKTAWRNLLRSKFYSLINMTGLTVGLTVGILILLWVNDERSYDSFHKKGADIYRLELFGGTGASKQIWPLIVAPMGPLARNELPQVVDQARMCENDLKIFKYREKSFTNEKIYYVDSSFFSMFDFPLVEGNASRPFAEAHSVIVTQRAAIKFFGVEPAIGKVITAEDKVNYTINGIIKDPPRNS